MSARRGVLLRSLPVLLPVLLFVLLATAAAPQRPASPRAAAHAAVAAEAPAAHAGTGAESTPAVEPPADRVAVLSAQFTAGPRGCRAPPVASV